MAMEMYFRRQPERMCKINTSSDNGTGAFLVRVPGGNYAVSSPCVALVRSLVYSSGGKGTVEHSHTVGPKWKHVTLRCRSYFFGNTTYAESSISFRFKGMLFPLVNQNPLSKNVI